jgi:hypothetical protein
MMLLRDRIGHERSRHVECPTAERRGTAEGMDIEALKKAEESARAATSVDGAPVHEAAIVSARHAEETAKSRHEALLGELRMAEGALHASGSAFDVRIFSTRYFGVYDSGPAKRGSAACVRGAAHCPQNLWAGGFAAPHEGQLEASGAAH